jgi:nicotinate-nucleotide adenylyltransferase
VIFSLATPLIVHRPGEADPDLRGLAPLGTAETQPQVIEMRPVDMSSTEIRRRVAAGETLEGLVPESVADYITKHQLYV